MSGTWSPEKFQRICQRITVNEFVCSLSTVLYTGTLSSKNTLPAYRDPICLYLQYG